MCVGFLIGILVRVSLEVKPSLTKPKCQNNVLLKWKLDYGLLGELKLGQFIIHTLPSL